MISNKTHNPGLTYAIRQIMLEPRKGHTDEEVEGLSEEDEGSCGRVTKTVLGSAVTVTYAFTRSQNGCQKGQTG
jgi:hypothetical protein